MGFYAYGQSELDVVCRCGHKFSNHKVNTERCLDKSCTCQAFRPDQFVKCDNCAHSFIEHGREDSSGCNHEFDPAVSCGCPVFVHGYTGETKPEPGPCWCGHKETQHYKFADKKCKQESCWCAEYQQRTIPLSEKENTTMATSEKKYILPNGREYLTRSLPGFSNDVEAMHGLRTMGKHVLLLGEPGCGKTALLQAAFSDAENEIGHDKLTAWDMLWRPRPMPDGSIQFDPSPLNRAATEGKVFYFDEIMRANADALTPLFSAMDGRGFIVGGNIDGTDLKVAPGFLVVGASNPLVRGAFLPDAIASRFHILTVETSEDLLKRLKLDERLLVIWKNLSLLDNGECWRPSIREMISADEFIRAGNMAQAAYALTGWRVPARDRSTVANVIAPIFGVRVSDLGGVIK